MKLRHGVLEIIGITDDRALIRCLVHTDKQPFVLTLQQLQSGARQCMACVADSAELRPGAHNYTGQRFGDWVAIKNMGLSRHAGVIRLGRKKWRNNTPFGLAPLTYCRNKYWLCYCVHCHSEREIRSDKLGSGILPKCQCTKKK